MIFNKPIYLRLFCLNLSLLLLGIASPAVATVIYDGGLPNNAQWRNSDFSNQFSGEAADDFILQTDAIVTDVHWYGSYVFTASQPMPDDFTINFYNDVINSPEAAPFYTATFTSQITRTFTGEIVTNEWGDFEMYEYSVDIAPLSLSANTRYWLSIVNNTQQQISYGGWAWAYNQDGNSTHRWRTNAGGWQAFGSSNLAFSLTSSVPEPATLFLFGTSLIGLVGLRCRRKA